MTNGNNDSRLNRIEAIVESNSRAIQAMIEQQATDRLIHEERMEKHDREIVELKEISSRLTEVQSCLLYTSPSPRDLSTSRMPSSA